jgi:hypothetical protein
MITGADLTGRTRRPASSDFPASPQVMAEKCDEFGLER